MHNKYLQTQKPISTIIYSTFYCKKMRLQDRREVQAMKWNPTFITSLSSVLFKEDGSMLGRNCSPLKMESILNASSDVMSSLPCCPKLWKTSNYLSKITSLWHSTDYTSKVQIKNKVFMLYCNINQNLKDNNKQQCKWHINTL